MPDMHLFSVSKQQIKGIRTLDDQEFAIYEAAVRRLLSYRRAVAAYNLIEAAYYEFERELGIIGAEIIILGGRVNDSSDLPGRMNLRLLNLMAAMRLYVDQSLFRLSRWYGPKSPERGRFRDLTKAAYDDAFAYRFLYKLRNFGQHCGMPLGLAAVSSRLTKPPALDTEHSLRIVFLTRDLLAEDRAVWGPVASELEKQPDEIAAAPLVREVVGIMRKIVAEAEMLDRPHLRQRAEEIHSIVHEAFEHGGGPVVGSLEDDDGGGNFRAMPPPAELMRSLGFPQYRTVL